MKRGSVWAWGRGLLLASALALPAGPTLSDEYVNPLTAVGRFLDMDGSRLSPDIPAGSIALYAGGIIPVATRPFARLGPEYGIELRRRRWVFQFGTYKGRFRDLLLVPGDVHWPDGDAIQRADSLAFATRTKLNAFTCSVGIAFDGWAGTFVVLSAGIDIAAKARFITNVGYHGLHESLEIRRGPLSIWSSLRQFWGGPYDVPGSPDEVRSTYLVFGLRFSTYLFPLGFSGRTR